MTWLRPSPPQVRGSSAAGPKLMRQALESYLDDFNDLAVAVERLHNPFDLVLDWDEAKRDLLRSDYEQRREGTTGYFAARSRPHHLRN